MRDNRGAPVIPHEDRHLQRQLHQTAAALESSHKPDFWLALIYDSRVIDSAPPPGLSDKNLALDGQGSSESSQRPLADWVVVVRACCCELLACFAIDRYCTGTDVIDPAMQGKIALFQSSRNRGMRAQVFQLCDYIFFSQREKKFGARFCFPVIHFRVAQPGRHIRKSFQRLGMERASHDTAIGVAADDDLRHPQHAHRIFDRGRNTAKRIRVRRYNIANHTADEQIARFGLGQQARVYSGISARDKQCLRAPRRERPS
jgi:hypothetical protein